MSIEDEERAPVFHERITELKNRGYRGFVIHKMSSKWDNVKLTARDKKGRTLKTSGETQEEAYKKMIDLIDATLDEPK